MLFLQPRDLREGSLGIVCGVLILSIQDVTASAISELL